MQTCETCKGNFSITKHRDYNDGELFMSNYPTESRAKYCPFCGKALGRAPEPGLLATLESVSEIIARWSLNRGILDPARLHMSNHDIQEVNNLNLILETAIVGAGGEW